jgi:hypothetical protein
VCVGRGCHGLRRMSCGRDGVVASHYAISHVRFIASQPRSMTQSTRKVASRHGHAGAHSCTDNDRTRRDLTSARTRPIAASDQSDAPTCALDDSSRSGTASGTHVVSCGSGRPARLARQSRRPKGCRLATHPALRRAVAMKRARQWSTADHPVLGGGDRGGHVGPRHRIRYRGFARV